MRLCCTAEKCGMSCPDLPSSAPADSGYPGTVPACRACSRQNPPAHPKQGCCGWLPGLSYTAPVRRALPGQALPPVQTSGSPPQPRPHPVPAGHGKAFPASGCPENHHCPQSRDTFPVPVRVPRCALQRVPRFSGGLLLHVLPVRHIRRRWLRWHRWNHHPPAGPQDSDRSGAGCCPRSGGDIAPHCRPEQ